MRADATLTEGLARGPPRAPGSERQDTPEPGIVKARPRLERQEPLGHTRQFAQLVLDDDSLHTPNGDMPLESITRAEFVRDVVSDGSGPSTSETSAPAVAGGAVVGGVLFGAAGAVVGGVLGSTVKEDVPGTPKFRTESVEIVFETNELTYSMDIAREQEMDANAFAKAVHKAAKHKQK